MRDDESAARVLRLPYDRPDRFFQVWGYGVGMGQLVLRSNTSPDFPTRLGVRFQNTQGMHLTSVLRGLLVSAAGPEDIETISRQSGIRPGEASTFYCVRSGSFSGYVIASVAVEWEDSGEFYDPPPDDDGFRPLPI